MKERVSPAINAHLLRGGCYVVLLLAGTLLVFFRLEAPAGVSHRTLTFAERVAYQRAIEEVYWRRRIWPKERPNPKPSLDAVMTQAQLEKRVSDYLRKSQALEDYWQRPITAEQLQAEVDRMARRTMQPEVLRELFAALGNNPFVIAECLARQVLMERSLVYSGTEHVKQTRVTYHEVVADTGKYSVPAISDWAGCTDDSWEATSTSNAPDGREFHTAVWTGTEMIVWGGEVGTYPIQYFDSGGRYDPDADSWASTSEIGAPTARSLHSAIWSGNEMIVWGGQVTAFDAATSTGARYCGQPPTVRVTPTPRPRPTPAPRP